ncbi:hypothetical protein [Parachitinimonas caeni]|uniref:DUF4034 domain-containing protein n=1 Tax=Parachitinimonas caeni TaxID=3031301 RepID=A0ABT7DRS5_9NEIS|nr:hypothetical protein [Parachitinimonas caeni]MDK2122764.1 hypothetical protein [Parachitinimonas caeni]
MKISTNIAVGLLLAIFPLISAGADELGDRRRFFLETQHALEYEDFARLEKMHMKSLDTKERFPSGVWKMVSFRDGLERIFSGENTNQYWNDQERRAVTWRTQFPKSAIAQVFLARVYLQRSYALRGDRSSNAVPANEWLKINQYTEKAYKTLMEGGPAARSTPIWYLTMLEVLNHKDVNSRELPQIINEALEKFPSFQALYFDIAELRLPRNGGSYEAVEKFAQEAVVRNKSGEGWAIYARIYWYLTQVEFGNSLFSKSRVNWASMRDGFDAMLKQYPDIWNLNAYGYFSCLAKDRTNLIKLLRQIGTQVNFQLWGGDRGQYVYKLCSEYAKGHDAAIKEIP